jgi:hypothetical protein
MEEGLNACATAGDKIVFGVILEEGRDITFSKDLSFFATCWVS